MVDITYFGLTTKRYLPALRPWTELIKVHDAWVYALIWSLECKPTDHRDTTGASSCFSHAKVKTGSWHRLYPQGCWIVNLDVRAAVAKRYHHLHFVRALKLRLERYWLTAMIVLRCVSNVDFPSLKNSRLEGSFLSVRYNYITGTTPSA